MKNLEKTKLELQAERCRYDALKMVEAAHSGHLGGSFSVMEILTVLYFRTMKLDTKRPKNPERDRCVLSKGHCTPAMYSVLAERGFFPKEDLLTFRSIDSYLSGHVEMTKVPGIDMSAGSLGQGLSAALGMALAGNLDDLDYRVYCICGDGECQEGQIWEAAQAASHFCANKLTLIIDNNKIQLDDFTGLIGGNSRLADKFEAFGWHVIEINGHDVSQIDSALEEAAEVKTKPSVIVANTVKGKGVSFMENNPQWHGGLPSASQFAEAFSEVQEKIDFLTGEEDYEN
jgi:transketolase